MNVMDLAAYRSSAGERERLEEILRLLPRNRQSILEIGARDGFHTRRLAALFPAVTALDLRKPDLNIRGVVQLEGDVTRLDFDDDSFDCVLCCEVLEHVPELSRAAGEIRRVARHEALIGVPYRQDPRVGKSTCAHCGCVNPAFGHVNTFDEQMLIRLFSPMEPAAIRFVGRRRERTNAVSSWLMDRAGNPWGTYGQEETCIHCGLSLAPPASRSAIQRMSSRLGHIVDRLQAPVVRPVAAWLHILFSKAS